MHDFQNVAHFPSSPYQETFEVNDRCELSYVAGPVSERVAILFGSQSGNAALVAESVAARLKSAGVSVTVLPEGGVETDVFGEFDTLFVCTSSHGNGELPDNLSETHSRLEKDRPDLGHLRFGVIALGDTTYHDTFCGAGATMDFLLEDLGAKRIKTRLEVDVSYQTFAEEPALEWISEWVASRG